MMTLQYHSCIQLSARCRVVDDGVQWIVQVRKEKSTSKNTGWRSRSFHLERASLIAKACLLVPKASKIALLDALPERHP